MSNIQKSFRLTALLMLVFHLTACSYFFGDEGMFRDRKNDYRKPEAEVRTQVPDNLDDEAIIDLYPVPPLSPYSDGEMIDDLPLPIGVANIEAPVKIQSMGDVQWTLLHASASQVWPRLKEFLSNEGLVLTVENGAAGMIEARAADGVYRYRIEQGFQRNTSELSVRFLNSPTGAFWPERSSDMNKESAMVQKVAQFFANVSDKPAYSFAAQGISTKKKIEIEHDEQGGKVLVMLVNEQRAWLTLMQSLVKADFAISQQDESARTVETQFTPALPEAKKPGWFKRMFFIKADPYDKDVKYAGNHYHFQLSADGDKARLTVRALDVKKASPEDIRKEQNSILLLLKERLY